MSGTTDILIVPWKFDQELITDFGSKLITYDETKSKWDLFEGTLGTKGFKEEHLEVSGGMTRSADEEFPVYRALDQRGHLEYSLNSMIPDGIDDPRLIFLKFTIKAISQSIHDHYLDRLDLDGMPLVVINKLDDDDIQLEFCQESYRMGFRIDKNVHESIWYLVTNDTFGNLRASGRIDGDYSIGIIRWLMYFIGLSA